MVYPGHGKITPLLDTKTVGEPKRKSFCLDSNLTVSGLR